MDARTDLALERLRYPIGHFEPPAEVAPAQLGEWIGQIESLPRELRALVGSMDASQLDTPYRSGGWRVRQVVHHLADSHINSYVRFKWALTEARPTIKAYEEQLWSELEDVDRLAIVDTLELLDALHRRWVILLKALSESQWRREFVHPVSGPIRLEQNAGAYAWHGRHHLEHIRSLAERLGWKR